MLLQALNFKLLLSPSVVKHQTRDCSSSTCGHTERINCFVAFIWKKQVLVDIEHRLFLFHQKAIKQPCELTCLLMLVSDGLPANEPEKPCSYEAV